MHVIFLMGQREGDACDWFTPTGDISQADTERGAECVPLETRLVIRATSAASLGIFQPP